MGLIEFAARFVEKARKNAHEVPGIKKTLFTSRQTKAISYLGIILTLLYILFTN